MAKIKKLEKKNENRIDQDPVPVGHLIENKPSNSYASFDQFWFKVKKEKGLPDSYKAAILAHFKAAGFNSPELFDAGLEHFGIA